MNKTILFFLFFSILALKNPESQAEKYGYQATWIVTAFGIDWPYKTTNPEEQKRKLEKIFKTLSQKKFNAVFFQVRIRADLAFPSNYEPFHEYFTGTYGKAPSYDIVRFAISLARRYGIEFHAWFNTMILRGRNATKKSVGVASIWERHPEWVDKRARRNPDQATAFLNPSIPEVRRHLSDLIVDFAKRYDVDGIQLGDYLRYPSTDFPDEEEYQKYNPNRLKLKDWRRENINQFVATLYKELMAVKPYLRFGVSPIGVYKRQDDQPAMESFSEVYQDSRAWTKRKVCDYLVPQTYFYIGPTTKSDKRKRKFNPAFEKLLENWGNNKNNRHVVAGLGIYKPKIKSEWKEQVKLSNRFNLDGVAFYPYNETVDIQEPFKYRKLVPPMIWKSKQKPSPPTDIKIRVRDNKIIISWQKPKNVHWVNIYFKSQSLVYPTFQNLYYSTIEIPKEKLELSNAIFFTSINRFGNESSFSGPFYIND